MQRRPHINWRLAVALARPLAGELPDTTRAETLAVTGALRVAARRAGELAVEFSGLDAARPADEIRVVDRDGWTRGAAEMVRHVIAALPMPERPDGWLRRVVGAGYGVAGGVALGVVSRQLLGQFDAFHPRRRLFLIAPNILSTERRRAFVPDDFRLWVGVHEQTHAVQFSAAPWLADYLMLRFRVVATDDLSALETFRQLPSRGVASLVASRTGQTAMDEITAAMTLLEGHADFVSDAAGDRHIPTVKALRRAFARAGGPHPLAKLLPALDKAAQYRSGLAFCRAVAEKVGVAGLAVAFTDEDSLPRLHEIASPAAWLQRVHGTT